MQANIKYLKDESGNIISPVTSVNSVYNGTSVLSNATKSVNGLMSKDDKAKLDGISSGANKTVVENVLTSTSTTNALSATQGKTLNDKIINLTPVILYNDVAGTKENVTLSENSNNFKYLEIFYCLSTKDDGNIYSSTKVNKQGKAQLSISRTVDASSVQIYTESINISGTTINIVQCCYYTFMEREIRFVGEDKNILVLQVIGYR